jgi:hypothetical protein
MRKLHFTTTINNHRATRDGKQQSNVTPPYGLNGPRISMYFPIKVRNLSLQQSILASSVAHPAFYPTDTDGSFLKRLRASKCQLTYLYLQG